jgi:drug/metabolite transporter (DMT)-like permease
LYGEKIPPLLSSYLFETTTGIFFSFFSFWVFLKKKTFFPLKKKHFFFTLLMASLIIFATYGVAKANEIFPFYIVNLSSIAIFVMSWVFTFFFLGEKFNKKQIFSSILILLALASIILNK